MDIIPCRLQVRVEGATITITTARPVDRGVWKVVHHPGLKITTALALHANLKMANVGSHFGPGLGLALCAMGACLEIPLQGEGRRNNQIKIKDHSHLNSHSAEDIKRKLLFLLFSAWGCVILKAGLYAIEDAFTSTPGGVSPTMTEGSSPAEGAGSITNTYYVHSAFPPNKMHHHSQPVCLKGVSCTGYFIPGL